LLDVADYAQLVEELELLREVQTAVKQIESGKVFRIAKRKPNYEGDFAIESDLVASGDEARLRAGAIHRSR
jgi:hypothetical protein